MAPAYRSFYEKVGQAFPKDYYDSLVGEGGARYSTGEVNSRMEAFVRDLFILITNKENARTMVDIRTIDYSWKYFMQDIESGFLKKGRLANRRRIMLVDMQEDKLEFPYVKDTYIYCVIALYYVKNLQERWNG